jgi:hypothetical protein
VNIRERDVLLFIITDKAKVRRPPLRGEVEGVKVMKDEDLRLEEIESSHVLTSMFPIFFGEGSPRETTVYYESIKRELEGRPNNI